ncbi:MAG: hypothetical protein HY795_18560 [Desulfovibrio sp.]|nr:hypothetical protein [Desulfovibrio sp.]
MTTLAVLVAACSGSTSPGVDTGPSDAGLADAGPADAGLGDPGSLVGAFNLELVAPSGEIPGSTTLVGRVSDGPTPSQIVWEPLRSEADCVLEIPRVPFCDPGCGGGAACVENDQCSSYPSARSVGAVVVDGLLTESGNGEVALVVVANNYQLPAAPKLTYPAFGQNDPIILRASGGVVDPFEIRATGISPLTVTSTSLQLVSERSLTLTWNSSGPSADVRIHIKLDISHHGGSKGRIQCELEDTGAFELPRTLLGELQGFGVAGFPTVVLTRQSRGATAIALGRVELRVLSVVERPVEIPGLTSCTTNEECPNGQSCQTNLACG